VFAACCGLMPWSASPLIATKRWLQSLAIRAECYLGRDPHRFRSQLFERSFARFEPAAVIDASRCH
jgi:hypothetical protein